MRFRLVGGKAARKRGNYYFFSAGTPHAHVPSASPKIRLRVLIKFCTGLQLNSQRLAELSIERLAELP